jgi:acetyltransferase
VLLFGSGGQLVEFYHDHALSLPPLNSTLARRMMERTRIFSALQGVRGRKPADLAALEDLVVRFSRLVVEQRWIREMDINPLLVSPEGLLALDARVVLHDPATQPEDLPRPAIRPYPVEYTGGWKLRDGTTVTIRPIRPEDEPAMVQFHKTLSEQTVYFRYFQVMKLSQRVAHERLTRICFIDYDRQITLVAESGAGEIIAAGRITRIRGTSEAEFAVLVSDLHQHAGIGTELLRRLMEVARAEKISKLIGEILPENRIMQRVAEKLGFDLRYELDEGVVHAEMRVL